MKHFVKLLFLDTKFPILLFGFCAPTMQTPYPWRKKEIIKKPSVLQYISILDESEKDRLLDILNTKATFNIEMKELLFNLELRPSVYSDTSGLEWENNKPVSKLHIINEYWRLDKLNLMNEIEKSYLPCSGKDLRYRIQHLFEALKRECGIDFSQEGERLGNFEFYTPGKYISSFEVKGDNYNTIILRKKDSIPEELIVNCAVENEGRCISDEIKAFSTDSNELTFSADEPMTHYKIKVWEKENGLLVYTSESAFIMEINIDMATTTQRVIHDPWTETLQQNASKHKDDIKNIENITVESRCDGVHANGKQMVPWRKARQDGRKICSLYKTEKTKGAFVRKTADRKGEIDSFQKVREYIEEKRVKKVVLADPYFSIKSAAKLLGRISSVNVELTVITALTSVDPDTSQNNADIKEQCKVFLYQNRNILHSNLTVLNVLHGTKPAFHDRYLIRYLENGNIDGFLLSNSLNSAGQIFPYVIAPLEFEVCLEVAEYLQNLTNEDYQNKLPEIEQVQIETLYNPQKNDKKIEQKKNYKLPQFLTGESKLEDAINSCIQLNYFKNSSTAESFDVLQEALPVIINTIFQNWDPKKPEIAITALGEALYHTYQGVYDAKDIVISIPDAITHFSQAISLLAKDMEDRQKHGQKPIHSEQFVYWSIMNGSAKPGSVSHWVDNLGNVYYKEDGYWSCLYELLWLLKPNEYFHILENIHSPLMLSILIEYICLYNYDKDMHELLLKSKWDWMHDLGAEWLWRNYKVKDFDMQSILDSFEMHSQLEQSAYLLSAAVFNARMLRANTPETEKTKAWKLCDELIERIVILCNDMNVSHEEQIRVLKKVKDCEQTCNALIIFSIAQSIKDEKVRDAQLDRIISTYFNCDHSLSCNLETDQQYIQLVVMTTELRYQDTFEKHVSSKLLHWDALNDWTEPYLRDRNYQRWNNSKKVLGWDIQFLKTYLNRGNELAGKLKIFFDRASAKSDLYD